MIGRYPGWTITLCLFLALIVQTTLFGRVRLAGVAPDLVMLVAILGTLRLSPQVALLSGFCSGLLMDTLGSNALGLRASVYTLVVFLGLSTRGRIDIGAVAIALWAATLSLLGVLSMLLLGSLFSQFSFSGAEILTRILLIPILNLLAALLLSPLSARLLERQEIVSRGE